jgi:adenylate kinase family enzyme
MKIYIVGAVASGKSTLARELSAQLAIEYTSLDQLVHISDKDSPWGNKKRPVEERSQLFQDIMQKQDFIIEDTGRKCFEEGMVQADYIFLLDTKPVIRKLRIVTRWIKQRLGLEKCIYRPDLRMLLCMLRWSRDYDTGKDNLKERLQVYQYKTEYIHNIQECLVFCKK